MTEYETLSIWLSSFAAVIALGSLVVSLISLNKTNKNSNRALDKSEVQNLIAMGNLELTIGERISNSRDKIGDITLIISPLVSKKSTSTLTPEEELTLTSQKNVLNAAIENNLNAYEDACSKYLDGKVDKLRFKRTYFTEIRQLVEYNQYQIYFNPLTSRFKAILKVYDEWNNLEK